MQIVLFILLALGLFLLILGVFRREVRSAGVVLGSIAIITFVGTSIDNYAKDTFIHELGDTYARQLTEEYLGLSLHMKRKHALFYKGEFSAQARSANSTTMYLITTKFKYAPVGVVNLDKLLACARHKRKPWYSFQKYNLDLLINKVMINEEPSIHLPPGDALAEVRTILHKCGIITQYLVMISKETNVREYPQTYVR